MKPIYKFKSEIVRFLINSKLKNPDISCRKLALEASQKFNIKLSKSAINNILKKDKLSSPVGRRSQHVFHPEGERNNGGFYIVKAIDELLGISKTAAEVLVNISTSAHKNFVKEIENIIQALIISKSINNTNIDFSICYNNKDIWQIVGKRPTKAVYDRIVKVLQNSQVFAEEVVREIRQRLNPVAGFRFTLRDGSSFFIDGALNSIWPKVARNRTFYTTYYKSDGYINELIKHDKVISIFNVQDISILSRDILNFIVSFDSQDLSKQIRQIELLGQEENIVATKTISMADRAFFLLGFWPWQFDMMSELERKPAQKKLVWQDLGIEYYYQLEEIFIPQHLVNKEVKLTAIILKNSPLGAARLGILTNLPKDVIHNYLSDKDLYHWFFPEDKYKDFLKKTKENPNLNLSSSEILSNMLKNRDLDNIFTSLGEIILEQFRFKFLPENFNNLDNFKIKEIFSKQKIILHPTKELLIHNFIIDKELWKETELKYTCQRLDEASIRDGQARFLWFQIK